MGRRASPVRVLPSWRISGRNELDANPSGGVSRKESIRALWDCGRPRRWLAYLARSRARRKTASQYSQFPVAWTSTQRRRHSIRRFVSPATAARLASSSQASERCACRGLLRLCSGDLLHASSESRRSSRPSLSGRPIHRPTGKNSRALVFEKSRRCPRSPPV